MRRAALALVAVLLGGAGPFRLARPVDAACISSPFGWRHAVGPMAPAGFHNGIDLPAPAGAIVRAAAAGRITKIERRGVGGLQVFVAHAGGLVTLYAHLGDVTPAIADGRTALDAGSPIGRVGRSGLTYGTHLFFAVFAAGRAVDPNLFLGLPRCGRDGISPRAGPGSSPIALARRNPPWAPGPRRGRDPDPVSAPIRSGQRRDVGGDRVAFGWREARGDVLHHRIVAAAGGEDTEIALDALRGQASQTWSARAGAAMPVEPVTGRARDDAAGRAVTEDSLAGRDRRRGDEDERAPASGDGPHTTRSNQETSPPRARASRARSLETPAMSGVDVASDGTIRRAAPSRSNT